jgi:hypothetical protein
VREAKRKSLDRLYVVARAYEGITASQIQAAFAKHITLRGFRRSS